MAVYEFRGKRPVRHETAWVAENASVIGDVALAEGVGVWFGATIRGDVNHIPVGARTNVQDGAMLHADHDAPLVVGEDCTIGHHAILHGCTVGDRVLIGMGAIVLNHAVIGDESIVGAGALVTEGKQFPPGSLIVGAPARAVRALDEKTRAFLKVSSAHYVENARAAAGEMVRVE